MNQGKALSNQSTDHGKLVNVLGSIAGALLLAALAVLGWIATKVWEMNPQVTETAKRVDRIVEALPDVRIRIAQEDLQRRIQVALLTTEATEVSKGKWLALVHELDFAAGTQRTFAAHVKGPDDDHAALLVSGLAARGSREKLSVHDYSLAAASAGGKTTSIPSFFDETASYAIIKPSTNYDQQLRQLFGAPIKETDLPKGAIKWEELAERLSTSEATYRPR